MIFETITDVFAVIGSNVIVLGFATWLGKLWLDRTNRDEKAKIDLRLKDIEHDYSLIKLKEESTVDIKSREKQASLDERMKKIEQNFDLLKTKDEHFHQISQETYQKMFDKKVEAYSKLFSLSQIISSSYPFVADDMVKKIITPETRKAADKFLLIPTIVVDDYYYSFREAFSENLSILSTELVDLYFSWKESMFMKNREINENMLLENYNAIKAHHDSLSSKLKNKEITVDEFMKGFEDSKTIDNTNITNEEKLNRVLNYHNNFKHFEPIIEQIRKDVKAINMKIDSILK